MPDTPIVYLVNNVDGDLFELERTQTVLPEPVSNLDEAIHAYISRFPKQGAEVRVPLGGPLLFRHESCCFSDLDYQLLTLSLGFDSNQVSCLCKARLSSVKSTQPLN